MWRKHPAFHESHKKSWFKKKKNLLATYMISSTNSNPPEMLGEYFILAAQVFKFPS